MKTLPRLITFLILVVAALATMSSVALGASRVLYSDEFNGPLDAASWAPLNPWGLKVGSSPELQYYSPANLSFASGGLRITTNNTPAGGRNYSSGVITSLPRAEFGYGYFEMRAKLPKGKGIWPAFWLINNDCTHEIDAFELLGDNPNTVYMTYHYNDGEAYSTEYTGPDFSAGYHTFGVDWQPTSITWYIDGIQRGRYTGTIKADPLMVCANTAVGGAWPGNPDSTTQFPQYMDIDYLRINDTKPVANTAPVANANAYSTANATTLNVAAPGLLGNDTDAKSDALSASVLTQPAHGTLSLSANGSFTYTPSAGYAGADSFTYRAYDGAAYSPAAAVSITVAAPVVHTPVAVTDSYSTKAGTTLTVAAAGMLVNDTDSQGHTLIASTVTQPAHGTLSFKGDGSFVYVPSAGYTGSDSFTYLASDGTAVSATTKVTLTVGSTVAPKRQSVYRFLNRATNVHFYTASEAEKNTVVGTLSSTYSLEGVAYDLDTGASANNAPLYRFYDLKRGVHFYTASEAEKSNLINTMGHLYRYDGVACSVSLTSSGTQPVYRFYNVKKGVHFYTASLAERDSVVAQLSSTYRYEGVAYYYAPSL